MISCVPSTAATVPLTDPLMATRSKRLCSSAPRDAASATDEAPSAPASAHTLTRKRLIKDSGPQQPVLRSAALVGYRLSGRRRISRRSRVQTNVRGPGRTNVRRSFSRHVAPASTACVGWHFDAHAPCWRGGPRGWRVGVGFRRLAAYVGVRRAVIGGWVSIRGSTRRRRQALKKRAGPTGGRLLGSGEEVLL